jgi:hypothetical protein
MIKPIKSLSYVIASFLLILAAIYADQSYAITSPDGGYHSGKVFFDNLSIVPLDLTVTEGQHIQMTLKSADISVISSDSYGKWISHLDAAYESYLDLVGVEPYPGEKMKVLSTRNYPGGWAVAGNPILWYQPYVKGEL